MGPPRIGRFLHALPRADLAVALALLAVAQAEVWSRVPAGSRLASALAAFFVTTPLIWRRRAPLVAATLVLGTFAVHLLVTGDPPPALGDPPNSFAVGFAWLVAVYSVGAHHDVRRSLVGLATALAVTGLFMVAAPPHSFEVFLGVFLFSVAVPWLAGALRGWQLRAARLKDLARSLERDQEEKAKSAAAEERSRIVRELHDIVAHSVSVAVVQAEAGETLVGQDPERAREAFQSIQRTGRQALGELRRLFGLLRAGDSPATLSPQPGLGQLASLVAELQDAGLSVNLNVDGQPRTLPPGVDLSAYRVVQEALTNTLRHARHARAEVTVRYRRDCVELEVLDNGPGPKPGEGGHGLAGMRERVAFYQGELEAGGRPEGGYVVRARLPLEADR